MRKRGLLIGNYDTVLYGWTLSGLQLTDPELKTNYVEKPGADGSWDLYPTISGGIPRYKQRTLTATLECSEGTRDERLELVSHMVNLLDGWEHQITLPDYPNHYLTGTVNVAVSYNDPAHACVVVTATCDPWLQAKVEKVHRITAEETARVLTLDNVGRRVLVPVVTVTGEGASFLIEYGTLSLALGPGTYKLPDLLLYPGNTAITCSGSGGAEFSYREAVLG